MGVSAYAHPTASGTVVTVSGEVDGGSAAVFQELLLRAARAHRPLLLDLSGIDVMDFTGLSALITIRNLAAARDRTFRVVAASKAVRAQVDLAGTEHLI